MSTKSHTVFDVMNCEPIKSVSDLPPGDRWMEPKLDGFRLLAHVIDDRTVHFYTRSKKRQDGKLPHLEAELAQIFPPDTVLDGEIVALTFETDDEGNLTRITNNFEYVQSVMLSKPEVARMKQVADRPLKYIAFDMIQAGGVDIREEPAEKRVRTLQAALGASGAQWVAPMEVFPATDEVYEALVDNGFEGAIVKDAQGRYLSGYRGKHWFKMKAQPTVDVIVLGKGKDGEGRNAGLVGSVLFGHPKSSMPEKAERKIKSGKWKKGTVETVGGVEYVSRGQAGGMTDAERRFITDNLDSLLGTVIEVSHMGIYPDGITMRHPQFVRFRDDKRAEDVEWHDR